MLLPVHYLNTFALNSSKKVVHDSRSVLVTKLGMCIVCAFYPVLSHIINLPDGTIFCSSGKKQPNSRAEGNPRDTSNNSNPFRVTMTPSKFGT